MRCDFRISSASKRAGSDLDAKNSSRAGIEGVLLAKPERHEVGLDEEPENRFGRCGNENLAFNFFSRDNPPPQNNASSVCSLAIAD